MFTIIASSILILAETLWRARLDLMHFHMLSAHDLCAWLLVTQCDLAGKIYSIVAVRVYSMFLSPWKSFAVYNKSEC